MSGERLPHPPKPLRETMLTNSKRTMRSRSVIRDFERCESQRIHFLDSYAGILQALETVELLLWTWTAEVAARECHVDGHLSVVVEACF